MDNTNTKCVSLHFIRPHQALDGLTPVEKARINLNPKRNKWLSLIKQSMKDKEILKVAIKKP